MAQSVKLPISQITALIALASRLITCRCLLALVPVTINAETHIGHDTATTAYLAHVANIFSLRRRQTNLSYQLLHFSNLRNIHLSYI